MMVLKKKEIIAASLVVMIGVAGYLNWSYQDTLRVADNDIYAETSKKLGEAQYVNSSSVDQSETENSIQPTPETKNSEQTLSEPATDVNGYFEQAKLDRETSRSQSLEILNATASNEAFDSDTRKEAQERILKISENVEKETSVENIAKAKGYANICVYVEDSMVTITVQKDGFSQDDAVRLSQIATEQLKISANNVKVVEFTGKV